MKPNQVKALKVGVLLTEGVFLCLFFVVCKKKAVHVTPGCYEYAELRDDQGELHVAVGNRLKANDRSSAESGYCVNLLEDLIVLDHLKKGSIIERKVVAANACSFRFIWVLWRQGQVEAGARERSGTQKTWLVVEQGKDKLSIDTTLNFFSWNMEKMCYQFRDNPGQEWQSGEL